MSDVPAAAALRHFVELLDSYLVGTNADYADHRQGGMHMMEPELAVAPPGTFAAWMKERGKLGGQNKVPRVLGDVAMLDALRKMTEQRRNDA